MRVAFDLAKLSDRLLGCLIEDSREHSEVSIVGRAVHDALVSERVRRAAAKASIPYEAVTLELPFLSFDEMAATLNELSSWADRLEVAAHFSDERGAAEILEGVDMLHAIEQAIALQRDALMMASEAALN